MHLVYFVGKARVMVRAASKNNSAFADVRLFHYY